ncbi:sugar ABC transporter permease [Mesomycoplasma flocculare]|uniref:Xylose transport system permease protein XylH n=1 Tax=Mesomycoplasma flocculare ATCC 27399 TaxID=743971 RepID=A0A0A8E663_MESFC|nr:xylose ABC transporter permease [Mesomycoplasma flocculare]AJC49725.1 sugar ABC transporter permease protein [Mesomycoplasma flocculare ATCC 27399]ENX51118.1 xylose ABC transporter permease protein [Mesomycoplasma flocculare ATCC 27716]
MEFYNSVKIILKDLSKPVKNWLKETKSGNYISSSLHHLKKFSMLYIFLLVFVIFLGITKGTLLQANTFTLLFQNNSYIIILAMGMLLVILSGNIDLSVGTLVGLLGLFSVYIYNNTGQSIWLTFILTTLIGAIIGFMQGWLIGYGNIPAFIVTLGGFLAFKGAQLVYSNGATLTPIGSVDSTYIKGTIGGIPDLKIGPIWMFSLFLPLILGAIIVALRTWGYYTKRKFGIKVQNIIIFLIIQVIIFSLFLACGIIFSLGDKSMRYYVLYVGIALALFTFLSQNTAFGRSVYAIGGNRKAALLSGVNVKRTTMIIFIIIGALAGFSSIIFTATYSSATSSRGDDLALDVISVVFTGGASVYGGIGSVSGTILGTSIIGVINQGLLVLNVAESQKYIIKGLILVAVVGWDVLSNKKNN